MQLNSSSKHNPLRGIIWFILSLIICSGNDVLTKHLGDDFHPFQVVFMRFFFGTLSLLPWMFARQRRAFSTQRIGFYVLRGALLWGGLALWCYGLRTTPIAVASSIDFIIPIITMLMAIPLLREHISPKRWMAAIVGFMGVWIIINPGKDAFPFLPAMLMLLSASMFALLDILNKKYLLAEGVLTMLFYTALLTMLLSLGPAIRVWVPISSSSMRLFFRLGCGANLILYCILKSFEQAEVSAIVPFRYVELIIAAVFGYVFFHECISMRMLLGAFVIVTSSIYLAREETRRNAEKHYSSCC
ncbi:MAG: DMT family transporter [Puniceicoccales bacterium]|jgi:S-adenosylmethionine uptake transporter|nr:DMT family transporter [Puniceicoccales bacterium]